MKVVLLEEARRRFEAEDEWWRAHRDDIVEIHSVWGARLERGPTL